MPVMHRDMQIGLVAAILLHGALHAVAASLPQPAPEERVEMLMARAVQEDVQLPAPPPPPPPPPPEPKKLEEKPKVEDKSAVKPKPRGQPKRKKKKADKPEADKPPSTDEPPPLVLSKTYDSGSGEGGVVVQSGEEDIFGDPAVEANERNTRVRDADEAEKLVTPAAPGAAPEAEKQVQIVRAIPINCSTFEWPVGAPVGRRIVEVTLLLTIDRAGKVTKARVLRSAGEPFDGAASRALKACRFKPGRRDGKTFVDRVTFIAAFRPGNDA